MREEDAKTGKTRDVDDEKIDLMEREFNTLTKVTNRKIIRAVPIFVALLIFTSIFLVGIHGTGWAAGAVILLYIFGTFLYLSFDVSSQTKDILNKRGLKCPKCGSLPSSDEAKEVYRTKICKQCKTKLVVK